jgi:hypothetical protein
MRCYDIVTVSYWNPAVYWFWRYRWLPCFPWWSSAYGPVAPYTLYPAYTPIPREQEIAMLEDQKRFLEEALNRINSRLEELKKEE